MSAVEYLVTGIVIGIALTLTIELVVLRLGAWLFEGAPGRR